MRRKVRRQCSIELLRDLRRWAAFRVSMADCVRVLEAVGGEDLEMAQERLVEEGLIDESWRHDWGFGDWLDDLDEMGEELLDLFLEGFPAQHETPLDPVEPERYGYDQRAAIPVNGIFGEIEFLKNLRCPCGEPFLFHRQGSSLVPPMMYPVDAYRLRCRNGEHTYTLYFDMYSEETNPRVPEGLMWGFGPGGVGVNFFLEDFEEFTFEDMQRFIIEFSREEAEEDDPGETPGEGGWVQ